MANEVKTNQKPGIYGTLSIIDITEYIKEKNKNKYLPWASCWNIVMSHYPHSHYCVGTQEIYISEQAIPTDADNAIKSISEQTVNRPWFEFGGSGWVEVSVVIKDDETKEEVSHTETYPILDYKNQSISADLIKTSDVNKSIKRALVKAVATCTGLGMFLFYGEDLPEEISKVLDLQNEVKELAEKRSALSDKAKEKCIELTKAADREANPDLADDLITGKVSNINDATILENLKKKLLAVRK